MGLLPSFAMAHKNRFMHAYTNQFKYTYLIQILMLVTKCRYLFHYIGLLSLTNGRLNPEPVSGHKDRFAKTISHPIISSMKWIHAFSYRPRLPFYPFSISSNMFSLFIPKTFLSLFNITAFSSAFSLNLLLTMC